jgi:hypothetical protein
LMESRNALKKRYGSAVRQVDRSPAERQLPAL